MKKLIFFLISIIFLIYPVRAETMPTENIYEEQFKLSGAEKLADSLPKETGGVLDKIGVSGENWSEITKLTPQALFGEVLNQGKQKAAGPFAALAPVVAVILLNAVIENVGGSLGNPRISRVVTAVSAICICSCIVSPLIKSISSMAVVIKCAAGFMLCFIPVMTGIMIASGQSISAASYHVTMLVAGQVISQIAANFLVPVMSAALGLSVISSISPRLKLNSLSASLHKIIKWVLGFSTSTFTGLLTLQSIVSSSADSMGSKTVKFALSSFVPIVGSALGDALGTVQGCIKLLKSGVGAFGMLAGGAIFLPLILECGIWIIFLNACSSIGDMFELTRISGLLKASGRTMSTMLAIILSCMMILVVSTVLILIIGGRV